MGSFSPTGQGWPRRTCEVRSPVADRPALEPTPEPLLETDEAHHGDVRRYRPRGAFGELVSEGVGAKVAGEYRLADPEAAGNGERVDAGALDGAQNATVTGGPGYDLTRSAPRRSVPRAAR